MLRKCLAAAIVTIMSTQPALAAGPVEQNRNDDGFMVDANTQQARSAAGVTMLADLAVGESAYVQNASYCVQNHSLYVIGVSEVIDPPEWTVTPKVKRLAKNRVSVELVPGDEVEEPISAVHSRIADITLTFKCPLMTSGREQDDMRLYRVIRLNGYKSMTEIIKKEFNK